jgi:hypothetical protein
MLNNGTTLFVSCRCLPYYAHESQSVSSNTSRLVHKWKGRTIICKLATPADHSVTDNTGPTMDGMMDPRKRITSGSHEILES